MDREPEPASEAAPAPLHEVRRSIHSDLQYVSLQVEGRTYGGWYRVLPDGRMELLALANMHSERRHERTPIEQARGMLTDFIRAARPTSKTNRAAVDAGTEVDVPTSKTRRDSTPGTLGGLLYADRAKAHVCEQDWLGLVQSIAAGDQLGLHQLFERTHRVVFTLMMRLTQDRKAAEELTLDVFHDAWRRARDYDAAAGSVVGWIMNQARSRALDHLGCDGRNKRTQPRAGSAPAVSAANGSDEARDRSEQGGLLRPSEALLGRLAWRIAADRSGQPTSLPTRQWIEPDWEEVAPGISCKLLATDSENDRVSMLVRLAPGGEYPPHRHAGVEELHLLHGELVIDGKKLHPGDYNRVESGSADGRVWSATGCTCVLITSMRDVLG